MSFIWPSSCDLEVFKFILPHCAFWTELEADLLKVSLAVSLPYDCLYNSLFFGCVLLHMVPQQISYQMLVLWLVYFCMVAPSRLMAILVCSSAVYPCHTCHHDFLFFGHLRVHGWWFWNHWLSRIHWAKQNKVLISFWLLALITRHPSSTVIFQIMFWSQGNCKINMV